MTSDAVIAALKSVQQDHIAEMASCLCGFWLGRRDDFWERWWDHVIREAAAAAEPAALRALIEWALADREARTHDLQGETLIPTWVIGDRADALKWCCSDVPPDRRGSGHKECS